MKKTACIAFVDGCPRSALNTISAMRLLKVNGWRLTNNLNKADLIFLSLCGFDAMSEDLSLEFLSITQKKKRDDTQLGILGCICEINKAAVDADDAKLIGYRGLEGINDLIGGKIKFKELPDSYALHEHLTYLRGSFNRLDRLRVLLNMIRRCPERFITYLKPGFGPKSLLPWYEKSYHLRIAKGCLGACTYCAIRFAAGHLSSRPQGDIQAQFRSGLDQGYDVFRLLGEDVGAYGLDLKSNIVELLEGLFDFKEQFQIVIEDLSPRWFVRFSDGLLRIISDNPMRIHHIVVPVQSGSPAILRAMRRGYHAIDVERSVQKLRQISPAIRLSTHVLVGFPGETEDDFLETIAFLERTSFNDIVAHRYTDRPNTISSRMPNKIAESEKIKRIWRLRRKFPKSCRIRI